MPDPSPLRWIITGSPYVYKKPSAEPFMGMLLPTPGTRADGVFLEGYNVLTGEMEKRYGPFKQGLSSEPSFTGPTDLEQFAKRMNINLEANHPEHP